MPKPSTAGGASIAQAAANNVQQKNWQPRGGEVEFTLRSFVSLPPEAQVLVCFRWKTEPDGVDPYVESRPSRLDRSSDGLTLKVTTTVPNLLRFSSDRGARVHNRLGFVPVADVRVLVLGKDNAPVADASTAIGVPSRMLALGFASVTIALALGILYLVATWRLTHPKIRASELDAAHHRNAIRPGQPVAIADRPVDAGGRRLGGLRHGRIREISFRSATEPWCCWGSRERRASPPRRTARGRRPRRPPPGHRPEITAPRLSDLLMSDSSQGEVGEIDVARMQMLLFTLIAAVFVTTKVFVSFVIPDIPEGFQILMGISNAVYMGAKVAQK